MKRNTLNKSAIAMGVSQFPVLERGQCDWALTLDGKRLARAAVQLAEVAQRRGVPDLFYFYSMSRDQAAIECGVYFDFNEFVERWFDAEAGLRTVRALLAYCREHPTRLAEPGIAEDLHALEAILSQAAAQGVRWHLGQDA